MAGEGRGVAGEWSGGGVAGEGTDWNMVAQLVIFTLSNLMSGVIHVHHPHSYINAQLTVTWQSLTPVTCTSVCVCAYVCVCMCV